MPPPKGLETFLWPITQRFRAGLITWKEAGSDGHGFSDGAYALTFTLLLGALLRCALKRSTVAWPAFFARQS